jgi:hypothetical protein
MSATAPRTGSSDEADDGRVASEGVRRSPYDKPYIVVDTRNQRKTYGLRKCKLQMQAP